MGRLTPAEWHRLRLTLFCKHGYRIGGGGCRCARSGRQPHFSSRFTKRTRFSLLPTPQQQRDSDAQEARRTARRQRRLQKNIDAQLQALQLPVAAPTRSPASSSA